MEERVSLDTGAKLGLTVRNLSTRLQRFALFQRYRAVADPVEDIQGPAWIVGTAAPGSENNPSEVSFAWGTDLRLTAGSSRYGQGNDGYWRAASLSGLPVRADGEGTASVAYAGVFPDGVPILKGSVARQDDGFLQIRSDGSIPTGRQQGGLDVALTIGLAMAGRWAMAVALVPNTLYRFDLRPTYHIVAGPFSVGQAIAAPVMSGTFEIDFEGLDRRDLVFNEDNTFSYG